MSINTKARKERETLPRCPLMSAGQSVEKLCTQSDCAWYMPSTKTCAVFILAHNALLEIKKKQS